MVGHVCETSSGEFVEPLWVQVPIISKVAGSTVRRESTTDCFLCEQDFFILQRPELGDNLYIYWENGS